MLALAVQARVASGVPPEASRVGAGTHGLLGLVSHSKEGSASCGLRSPFWSVSDVAVAVDLDLPQPVFSSVRV